VVAVLRATEWVPGTAPADGHRFDRLPAHDGCRVGTGSAFDGMSGPSGGHQI